MKFSLKPEKLLKLVLFALLILIVFPIIIFLYLGLDLYFKKPIQTGESFDITSQIVKIDDLEIFYKTTGDSAKPPLVYIHGVGGTYEFVESIESPLLAELGKEFYVYAPELPGHHRSQVPSQDISPEYYVDFVNKFIEQLKVDKPVLVGQSYGGRVVTLYVTKYQDKVSLLVIGDSSGAVKQQTLAQRLAPTTKHLVDFVYSNSLVPTKLKHFFPRYWFSVPEDKIDNQNYSKYIVMRGLFAPTYFAEGLKDLKVPTLIIWGKNDKQFPVEQAERLKEVLPNSRLEVFDAGHTAMATHPEKTRLLILEEWKKLENK